jgi:cell division protein FtsB
MRFALALILLTGVAIVFVIRYERTRADYLEALNEERSLKQQLSDLRNENERLKREIYLMTSDPFYLEKYARDAYGLAKSNELIYKLEK